MSKKKNEEAVEVTQEEEVVDETLEVVDEVEQLKQTLEEKEDELLRARAEMANMHKRFATERQALQKYRSQDLATKILPSLDNIGRALALPELPESVAKGLKMVEDSLLNALKEAGVEEIAAENQAFDPNLHQAVQTTEKSDGQESDTIVQVLQKGYQLQDRVLRPSMVVVAQ
ncbi:MAG: nucleotide exchange factor GrpE [Streptococcaceae bacterium]|nr:nucleotide exchange factor GrpE [Streptococcaceae bacterium]